MLLTSSLRRLYMPPPSIWKKVDPFDNIEIYCANILALQVVCSSKVSWWKVFVMLLLYTLPHFLHFLIPLQVPAFCICFFLFGLEVALLVDSLLVGSCGFILLIFLPLLLCSIPFNLPLLAQSCLAYYLSFIIFYSFFCFPQCIFIHFYRNYSMCSDASMMISTFAWALVFFLVVWGTENHQILRSGFISLFTLPLGIVPSY